jgi:energy-coupling factor transporter ATP-binding protein EcfA2
MTSPAIVVTNLQYEYAGARVALNGVTLTVQTGETVGLVGPNGAGKSTFLLHLNGILPEVLHGEPRVFINGIPVLESNLPEIRRAVGLLFEDSDDQLFCPTVYEDVAFGPSQFGIPETEIKTLVSSALAKVGLAGFEQRATHQLSIGEKQRVCLAGILACSPSILVLDEPTRGLDPRGRRQLKSLLQSIAVTKIIASHDLELIAELCDRTVVLDEGRIVADGKTLEILSDEPLMLAHGLEMPHLLKHKHPH